LSEKCSQCNTDIITCFRCREKHCYHHYCPESEGSKKEYNIPPSEIWSEEVNQEKLKKTDEAFNRTK